MKNITTVKKSFLKQKQNKKRRRRRKIKTKQTKNIIVNAVNLLQNYLKKKKKKNVKHESVNKDLIFFKNHKAAVLIYVSKEFSFFYNFFFVEMVS